MSDFVLEATGLRVAYGGNVALDLPHLALRRGEVVTRSDIWEHVYEFNAAAESNMVDVLIGHLRRKLDAGPRETRLIHTRRTWADPYHRARVVTVVAAA